MRRLEQVAQQVTFAICLPLKSCKSPWLFVQAGWGGGWPLSGWGLQNLVDLLGADPGIGRPGALGRD